MKKITNLGLYSSKADLELCLGLVEDAYNDLMKGEHDWAKSQLQDILETFDRMDAPTVGGAPAAACEVVDFPSRR